MSTGTGEYWVAYAREIDSGGTVRTSWRKVGGSTGDTVTTEERPAYQRRVTTTAGRTDTTGSWKW